MKDLQDTSHISLDGRKFYNDIFTKFEKVKMKFNITIEIDEDGRYVVECTDLSGCLSEGETLKDAIENISEAIIFSPQTRHIIGYYGNNVCLSFQGQAVISILLPSKGLIGG